MRLGCVVCAMEEGGRGRGTREGSPPQNPPSPLSFFLFLRFCDFSSPPGSQEKKGVEGRLAERGEP